MNKNLIVILLFVLISSLPSARADLAYTLDDEKKWNTDNCKRIMSNYHGPSLAILNGRTNLAEFIVSKNGTIQWIYHPKSTLAPEFKRSIDEAIKLSSPLSCPELCRNKSCPYHLNYDPQRKPPIHLWAIDHPGEIHEIFTQAELQSHDTTTWAKTNAQKILSHINTSKIAGINAWAAYWFWLNPDGTVEDMQPIPVLLGRKNNCRAAKPIEEQLHHAIVTAKTFSYSGAPVSNNEPVGVIVIYSPYKPLGGLYIKTSLFDRAPNDVVIVQHKNKSRSR